jgi:hypothetical protein
MDYAGRESADWGSFYGATATSASHYSMAPLSYINWMSPPYQDPFDWDSQPAFPAYGDDVTNAAGYPFMLDTVPGAIPVMPNNMPLPVPRAVIPSAEDNETVVTHGLQSPSVDLHRSVGAASAPSDTGSSSGAFGSEPPSSRKGAYYIDGEGSRAPFKGLLRRRHASMRIADITNPATSSTGFTRAGASPTLEGEAADLIEFPSIHAYHEMLNQMRSECRRLTIDLNLVGFPPLSHIRGFMQAYFAKFHPVYPILSKSSLIGRGDTHWMLLLAIATVGATYITDRQFAAARQCLTRMLWTISLRQARVAFTGDEQVESRTPGSPGPSGAHLAVLQAYMLTICSMMASESRQTRAIGVLRYSIMESFHELGLFATSDATGQNARSIREGQSQLDHWVHEESQIRSAYLFWVSNFPRSHDMSFCSQFETVVGHDAHVSVWTQAAAADRRCQPTVALF